MGYIEQKKENRKKKIAWIWEVGRRRWVGLTLLIIILASFFLMIFSARDDFLVVDEKIHITAGYLHVWEGDYTFNTEHPPLLNDLAGLFAKIARPNLPERPPKSIGQWEYGDLFFFDSNNNVEKIVIWARLPFILLTLGLIYLSFLWAKTLFGPKAGLIAATLTAFCPNILAHGRLATTDIGVTFFFLLFFWLWRKYLLRPNWPRAFWLGIALALVCLAKFSGFLVLPIMLPFLVCAWVKNNEETWAKHFFNRLFELILMLLTAFVLFWLVYAFSSRAELNNATLSFNQFLAFPLDKFVQGYKILADHNSVGHWSYLNGQVDYKGWWQYFPLVLVYKVTLPIMLLLVLAIITFFKNHRNFLEESLLVLPIAVFLAVSMTSKIDIGIRHILVILPFLYIWLSRVVLSKNWWIKIVVVVLVMAEIVIAILAFPNYIAYFNQIAGGSRGGIKHLSDSNLDWDQNMIRFARYVRQQGIAKVYGLCWNGNDFNYYGIDYESVPSVPVKGVVVICAQQWVVPPEGFDFEWLKKYPPDVTIADGMYIWRFDQR